MKKIIITKVSVGVDHPLYNKLVECEVLRENTGFDGRQTYVRTVGNVLYENIQGLLYDKKGNFIRYDPIPPHLEKWEGWAINV